MGTSRSPTQAVHFFLSASHPLRRKGAQHSTCTFVENKTKKRQAKTKSIAETKKKQNLTKKHKKGRKKKYKERKQHTLLGVTHIKKRATTQPKQNLGEKKLGCHGIEQTAKRAIAFVKDSVFHLYLSVFLLPPSAQNASPTPPSSSLSHLSSPAFGVAFAASVRRLAPPLPPLLSRLHHFVPGECASRDKPPKLAAPLLRSLLLVRSFSFSLSLLLSLFRFSTRATYYAANREKHDRDVMSRPPPPPQLLPPLPQLLPPLQPLPPPFALSAPRRSVLGIP